MTVNALEWLAFCLSLCCVYCYGHSKKQGAIVGLITATTFIVWGLLDSPPAVATNVVFFLLHGRNLRRAFREQKQGVTT